MNFQYAYTMENEEALIAMLGYYAVSMLFGGGLGIVLYVFRSLGCYTIAKRRGLPHAWFAWVPVVDSYLLGCISDQYRYVVKGQDKSKRKWLLGLNICLTVLAFVILVMGFSLIFQAANLGMQGARANQWMSMVMKSALGLLAVAVPAAGVAIAAAVLRYMALYDLYASCDRTNHVIYLVLSIFINATEPFFIFFSRNKDEGMPPRRKTEPVVEAEPVFDTDYQTWEEPARAETWREEEQGD